MRKPISILLSYLVALPSFAQGSAFQRDFFTSFAKDGFAPAVNTLTVPPSIDCAPSAQISSAYLDELINKSYESDESCKVVFTGNAGDTHPGDVTYAKALAYAMAEEMCSNSELHQTFLNKDVSKNDEYSKDALRLDRFNSKSAGAASVDNVAATYALTYALGYRESGGNFKRARDPWAKLGGSEEESGFTQTSANSLNDPDGLGKPDGRHILPQKVFKQYLSSLSNMTSQSDMARFCLNDKLLGNQQTRLMENDQKSGGEKIEFDHEGKALFAMFNSSTSPCKSIANTPVGEFKARNDSSDPVVQCFKDLHKNCPGFSIKYGATIARTNANHHGPLKENQTKESPKPSCQTLFNAISQNKESVCSSIGNASNPESSIANSSLSLKTSTDYLSPNNTDKDEGPSPFYFSTEKSDTFRAPYKFNKPSDFTSGSVPLSDLPVAKELKEEEFRQFIADRSERSSGYCAKHVRMALNKLFGRGPAGGPSALKYDEQVLSQWQTETSKYKEVEDNGQFQDFDVRVLQPSSSGNPHGHIEIFYQGQWYSDFKQGGSLFDYNSGRYQSAKTYRLSPKTSASIIIKKLKMIAALIMPKAFAQEPAQNKKAIQPDRVVIIARANDVEGNEWQVANEDVGDYSFPVLYKLVKGKRTKIDEDGKSPYLLLNKLKDKKLAQNLAENLVNQWIKEQGRDHVQKIIKQRRNFFELEIQALKKLGLTPPSDYKILVN
jgi:hypothetical protein